MYFSDRSNPYECNEPKCRHGVNGGTRGGCSECYGVNDDREASMWLDTNNCNEHFHVIKRVDGKWIVLHSDDEECADTEFNVSELAA